MSLINQRNPDIGISNTVFGIRPAIEKDFADLRDNGFKKAEIVITKGWTDVDDTDNIRDIAKWSEKYDVEINSVHGPSGSPANAFWLADPDTGRRKLAISLMKKAIAGAEMLGAKYYIIEYESYTDWQNLKESDIDKPIYAKEHQILSQSIGEIVEAASKAGINLAIENIPGISYIKQLETVNRWDADKVSVCLDSSHATYRIESFFEEVKSLMPRVTTTHLSDNDGLPEDKWNDRHWLPFQGIIKWEKLIGMMVDSGYEGCFMLEVLNDRKGLTKELMDSVSLLKNIIVNKQYGK